MVGELELLGACVSIQWRTIGNVVTILTQEMRLAKENCC